MIVEHKAWKTAEANLDAARLAEEVARDAFRANLNKRPMWETARWETIIAAAAEEAAFDAYQSA